MQEYAIKSFDQCMFNPLAPNLLKNKTLETMLPNCPESERVLRYILALYDPRSPLVRDIRDIVMRKQTAAILVGFDLEIDTMFLHELFSYQNDEFVRVTDKFLKEFVHIRLWAMIVSNEETFYEYAARMRMPIGSSTKGDKDELSAVAIKSKLSADMDEINTRLDRYYDKLYEEESLRGKLQRQKITPETMSSSV